MSKPPRKKKVLSALEKAQLEAYNAQTEYYKMLAEEHEVAKKRAFYERREKLRKLSPVQIALYAKTGRIFKVYNTTAQAIHAEIARLQEELKDMEKTGLNKNYWR